MSKREVSYIISVSDRASAGFRKVAEGSRKARREVEGLESAAEDAGDAIEEAFDGDAVEGLSEELDKARRKTRQLGDEARESGRGFGGMAKEAKNFVKVLAAAEATKFFVKQGKAAVDAAAQMETYQATLETMLGSTQAARDRMEEYKDIAKITPFGLEDVVEAGNQLQAIGRYSRQNLEMLGDLAAASNKPMEQVMNAYAKLATGQKGEASRMFQDLLISRNDWIEATGKGVSKSGELLASTEEMIAALPKIMQSKGFFGMMAKQAETTGGKLSNLEDAVFSLRAAIGERMTPTVKNAVTGLAKLAGKMEDIVRIPLPQKIAQEKAELNALVGALISASGKEDERKRIIQEIQTKYPEFLKNINIEKATTEELTTALRAANAEYDKKIKKAALERRLQKFDEEADDAMEDIVVHQMALEAQKKRPELGKKGDDLLKEFGRQNKLENGERYVWDRLEHKVYKVKGSGLQAMMLPHNLTTQQEAEIQAIIDEYDTYTDMLTTWGGDEEKLKKAEKAYKKYKTGRQVIERAIDAEFGTDDSGDDNGATGGTDNNSTTSGTTGGSTPAIVAGTTYSGGSGSGGGSGKTVTTNIGTLVGTIEIHTTTLQEGAAEVKRLVTQALLEAVPSDL